MVFWAEFFLDTNQLSAQAFDFVDCSNLLRFEAVILEYLQDSLNRKVGINIQPGQLPRSCGRP